VNVSWKNMFNIKKSLIVIFFFFAKIPDKIWRRHRKILNPAFNAKILESFVPVFLEKSRILVEDLEQHVGKPSFDFMDMTTKCTLESTFGEK
jgi:cytochrome P450